MAKARKEIKIDKTTMTTNIEKAKDYAIQIERTPEFFEMAQQLSKFIYSLPLDTPTNDQLVALMVNQVQQAEKGAFSQGIRMGMEIAGKGQIKRKQNANSPVLS